jgi:parallel beta-helix repeat protein
VDGDGNRLIRNQATKQSSDGILVSGDNNILTNNKANDNRGNVGIEAVGQGNPAASSGNVVLGQGICVIYGSSDPAICAKK